MMCFSDVGSELSITIINLKKKSLFPVKHRYSSWMVKNAFIITIKIIIIIIIIIILTISNAL